MGVQAVRKAIANDQFNPENKEAAREWLAHVEADLSDLSRREQIRIARSAKNAAWAAAIAAIIAAICAAIAIYLSWGQSNV